MKYFMLVLLLCITGIATAQTDLSVYIKDKKTKEPLTGAIVSIPNTSAGAASDINGLAILSGIPPTRFPISCRMIGYEEHTDTLSATKDTLTIYLEPAEEEMEELIVSSTRSTRTIQDIATRVELIGGEELEEKANMKPGDIRMLLSESTGIQTLQTSATSGNSNIRIEGLDGRYTQILKDGFPLYSGFAGGLGLLQTPPLNLKRVEVIKGASSTLYGGGAIAGLINLISKTPGFDRELKFVANVTSAGGMDVDGYYGKRNKQTGFTVYAAYNANKPYDPSGNGFTAIPQFKRYTINPRLFIYPSEKTDIVIGINATFEDRQGGDVRYLLGDRDSLHSYFENNKTQRINTEFSITHRLSQTASITAKNSFGYFNRIIDAPSYTFDGFQNSTFSEVSYANHKEKMEWVAGINLYSDAFKERQLTPTPLRDYGLTTYGIFVQNTYNFTSKLIMESGLRSDYVSSYGAVLLPRLSLLYKVSSKLSSRLGGGIGYKTPTIFTEESERISYKNVLPVNNDVNTFEHSYGANWDVNFKTTLADGKISLSLNELLFYTELTSPLMLEKVSQDAYRFYNLRAKIEAKGAETNIKIGYKDFKLFLGYTYTHSHLHDGDFYRETPLTPRHHTNSVLMYEVENKWKVGLEAYYYSPQFLNDGSYSHDYWLCGFMAERIWKNISAYINFENFLDSRQTRYGPIYSGSPVNPQFKDIYAPLDGFIVNGGIKVRL
jgi:outer membrane receptor protein involved in Fe transport